MINRIFFFAILLGLSPVFARCTDKEEDTRFVADFEFAVHPTDANVIVFTNTTVGEQYYWQWKFGNGESGSRVPVEDKDITCFYPEKGEYEVTLTIWGSKSDLSDNKSITKKVTIADNVFLADFTVEPVAGKQNSYLLKNTTTGNYTQAGWTTNGKASANQNSELEVYFPFEGQNKVALKIKNGSYEKEVTKTISVQNDDPDFLTHYSLFWNEEYESESFDHDKWLFETGAHGWGNAEWQNYTNGDNVKISDGTLKIIAKKIGPGQKVGDYTSSRINSKQSFTYGIFEIRAKMPADKGPGVWPAIWMLGESIKKGTSWPLCGEIDIMEYVSFDPNTTSSTIHTQSNNHVNGNGIGSGHIPFPTAEEEFHNYGLIWTENFLRFYRDDMNNVILTYRKPASATPENWPFDQPFFLLLNMAIGGNYGGAMGVDDSIFPAQMEVEYVRVYRLNN